METMKHFATIVDAAGEGGGEGGGEEEERRRSEKREGSETICKIILSASPRRNSSRCKNEYIVSDAPRQNRDFFFCT